ncbi:hypothetical protein PybrP1_007649 [[Pythium] brassicae (nom. inval.)]|nr:hypothetical protein PybrP1_007649 [[Pythium] brassicae (nom. inval.)]
MDSPLSPPSPPSLPRLQLPEREELPDAARRTHETSVYGWTDRSSAARVIHVNRVLRDQVVATEQRGCDCSNSHEYRCLVFMVAIVIFRECAYLATRWKNILDSPEQFISGIQRSATSRASELCRTGGVWTADMPVLNVVLERDNGLDTVAPDVLATFFAPEPIDWQHMVPVDFVGAPPEHTMNPEVDEHPSVTAGAGKRARTPVKKHHILQRRLKDQISESRMLEVLDRQLQGDRANEPHRTNQDDEEELVCVSTMVAVEPSAATAPAEFEHRVCGVLKTVRCMQRQRATERGENQSDDSKPIAARPTAQ